MTASTPGTTTPLSSSTEPSGKSCWTLALLTTSPAAAAPAALAAELMILGIVVLEGWHLCKQLLSNC